jgi:outer membrane protein insertion porin family
VGAPSTRRGFLDRIFNPLLGANPGHPFEIQEALKKTDSAVDKLRRFGMLRTSILGASCADIVRTDVFHDDISMYVDSLDTAGPSSAASDIEIWLKVREKSRLMLRTGTDLGNAEGSAYGSLLWRNIFGGAESLSLNASAGTRTRSSYAAIFDTPILSNPDLRLSIDGLASSTYKAWASHEELLKGTSAKFKWITGSGGRHEVAYSAVWRQITSLANNASPSVRHDAGDTVKSSITHTWVDDRRNNPLLPSAGYMIKTISEIAGWGPLQGDVAFWKSEIETSAAQSVPLPGFPGDSGISITSGFRAGVIYPLPNGMDTLSQPSRINDRFQLGGPTDVRGFKIAGLGPRDGRDALGGDAYAAASASLLLPLPRLGKDSPLRFQVFANGGRLLALKHTGHREGMSHTAVRLNVCETVAELVRGLPSMTAGFGLVYAHPVARFELNFSLPLVLRKGEEGRKGLQFGVGINFL